MFDAGASIATHILGRRRNRDCARPYRTYALGWRWCNVPQPPEDPERLGHRAPMLGGVAKPRLAATLLIGAFFPFFRRPLARRDTARRRWTLRNTAIPKPFRTSTEMSGDPPRGGALGSHIETTHWRL